MYSARTFLWIPLLTALNMQAQTMTLQSGNLTIASGTTVELVGPLDFEIASGATVVNDGLIELGTEATLIEPANGPITGAGTEHALRDLNAAFNDNNIAGLGLTLSMNSALGPVAITRGHEPLLANGTIPSIARWYRLDAAPVPGEVLDIAFHYETSELNGASASDLVMHKAPQPTGSWYALPSTSQVGAQLVSVTDPGPWDYLTLFPQVINVSVTEYTDASSFTVLPTATIDRVQVTATGNEMIVKWELFSATGALLAGSNTHGSERSVVIDLSQFPAGAFILRLNDNQRYRLLKL